MSQSQQLFYRAMLAKASGLSKIAIGSAMVWRAAPGVYAIEEKTVTDILATDGLLRGLDPPAE